MLNRGKRNTAQLCSTKSSSMWFWKVLDKMKSQTLPLYEGKVILITMHSLMPIPAHNYTRSLEALERSTLLFPMLISQCYQSYQKEGPESILSCIIVDKLYYLQDTGKIIIHLKMKTGEWLWASLKAVNQQSIWSFMTAHGWNQWQAWIHLMSFRLCCIEWIYLNM